MHCEDAAPPLHTPDTPASSRESLSLKDLPGPAGWPLIGNLHQIAPDRIHKIIDGWCDAYGPRFRLRIGRRNIVVIGDEAEIRDCMRRRPEAFTRYASFQKISRELGLSGLFVAEGEAWQRHRRLWMRATHIHKVSAFHHGLAMLTRRFQGRLDSLAAEQQVFDLREELTRLTVDVTALFAFGQDANTTESGTAAIQRHLGQLLPAINRRMNAPFPYWRYVSLPADRQLAASQKALREVVDGFIERARQRIASAPDHPPSCLLESLLAAQRCGDGAISDEDLHGSTLLALIAGEDTTSATLAWIGAFLAHNPGLQEQAAGLALARFGARQFWQADAGESPGFLDALTAETLRLRPVAPLLFLATRQDVAIGPLLIPKDTDVLLACAWAMRQSELFPDVATFRPARWDEDRLKRFTRLPPMPFGGGPRICPGRNLAMAEMRAALSMLLSSYRLLPASAWDEIRDPFRFIPQPENLRVRLRHRDA